MPDFKKSPLKDALIFYTPFSFRNSVAIAVLVCKIIFHEATVNVVITATLLGQSKSSPSFEVFSLHDLQISDGLTFTSAYPDELYLDDPIWAQSYFNGLGKRYWRVRYNDGSGTPGPWSEVRNFEIK